VRLIIVRNFLEFNHIFADSSNTQSIKPLVLCSAYYCCQRRCVHTKPRNPPSLL